jgi:hypothetical protein
MYTERKKETIKDIKCNVHLPIITTMREDTIHSLIHSELAIAICSSTISTSDSDEILRTYMVTPTSTAGPVCKCD